MTPPDFPRLVIDGLNYTFAPQPVIRARPSIISIRRLVEVQTPAGMRIHDKQSGARIETGRPEIRQTALVGCNQAAIWCRLLCGIRNRLALFIKTRSPVHRPEWHGQKALAICP